MSACGSGCNFSGAQIGPNPAGPSGISQSCYEYINDIAVSLTINPGGVNCNGGASVTVQMTIPALPLGASYGFTAWNDLYICLSINGFQYITALDYFTGASYETLTCGADTYNFYLGATTNPATWGGGFWAYIEPTGGYPADGTPHCSPLLHPVDVSMSAGDVDVFTVLLSTEGGFGDVPTFNMITAEACTFSVAATYNYTPSSSGTGGGGGPGGGPGGGTVSPSTGPTGENSEFLDTRRAFYHAFASGDSGIAFYRSDQSFLPFNYAGFVVQTQGSALNTVEPRLERMEPGDLVDLIFRGGFATPTNALGNPQPLYGLYRMVSADRAESWSPLPPMQAGQLVAYFPTPGAKDKNGNPLMAKYGRQVWNCHTQEYLLFYNDTSQLDSMGNPTGQGYIQCNVYNAPPDGSLYIDPDGSGSPFPIDNTTLSADCSFDAIYCTDPTAHIRVAFTDTLGAIHHYISFDDGRTYNQVAPYSSP